MTKTRTPREGGREGSEGGRGGGQGEVLDRIRQKITHPHKIAHPPQNTTPVDNVF